jgi:hypothetical protein
VTEFVNTDELKGMHVRNADLSGARLHGVNMSGVKITDAWFFNADFSGAVGNLKINGVAVWPLIDAELNRLHPERTKLKPTDPPSLLDAWDTIDELWNKTIDRARALTPAKLHERVDREYSFVETLRHLIFATDAWLIRLVFDEPNAYHPFAVPPAWEETEESKPGLDDVLGVRRERRQRLRQWIESAPSAELMRMKTAPADGGHPQGQHVLLNCFHVVLDEEWCHHQYATRDLVTLGL